MQTILVAGAGKSSLFLIQYLISNASRNKWKIIVADGSEEALKDKVQRSSFVEKVVADISNNAEREALVKRADIVVSLMPPNLHILLAKDCLQHKKHLITSSYISPEMKEMSQSVKSAGLMFMCEMGLDPGIDHMTANQIIHSIQRVAAEITSFKSYCGGLIAPENDDNPWHYKFTWNPQNVITAGADGASYLSAGKEVDVPYEQIFDGAKRIKVDDLGYLAYYPNRDSMRYIDMYDLPDAKTFIRATLRHPSFCRGWQALVALGLTNQKDKISSKEGVYPNWVKLKTGYNNNVSLKKHVANKLNVPENDKVVSMLDWLGLFDERNLIKKSDSSAKLLLNLLQEKWKMQPHEKDMVVMQHEVEYNHKGKKNKLTSTMVLQGENRDHSAMAKTVGLPMAILTRLVMTKKINVPSGVLIPNMTAVYRPILTELNHYGITFKDEVE